VSKDTGRAPQAPNALPLPKDVQDLLSLGDFSDFTLQLLNLHNRIHRWVGGDMGLVDFAAYDPLFFSHHSMIDRIWYLWQIKNGPAGLPGVLNTVLPPFSMTVADVLDTTKLGYEYSLTQVSS
jgi:tyrosinase